MKKTLRPLLPFVGYGLLAGAVLFLFQLGRDFFMLSLHRIDLWISSIAVVFVVAGFILGIRFMPARRSKPSNEVASPDALLSKRETEVLELLLKNMSNKEICAALFIENSTLKTHINRIYKKMEVQNRRDLILKCENAQNTAELSS